MTPREGRVFDQLVRLYPSPYRSAYHREMRVLFADQLREARTRGRWAVVAVWVATILDIAATAPIQHIRREEAVAQPVDPVALPARRARRRSGWLLVAALPIVLLIVLQVLAPGFIDPLYANPPAIMGLPAGIFLLSLVLAASALSLVIVARVASDRVRALAILLLTAPAIAILFMGPFLILAIQNLES